ncbi:MAG: YncE family protein [Chloroflexi bacterium]|nr:YncE family protein [Chloroflexota bacterium]
MTRGRPDRDIGPILADWMEEVVPSRAPERLLEESFIRTMATKQAVRYPWDRILRRGSRGERLRAPGRYVLAGASVAIALVVGVALLRQQFTPANIGGPHPTASPSPTPGPSPTPTPGPTLTPITVTPEATIPVTGPVGMASDGESVWLFTASGQLLRIDPVTNTIGASVTLSPPTAYYQGLAVNKAGLWVTDWDASLVKRFDPTTLKATTSIAVGPNPKGVLTTDSAVWVANTRGGTVARIDPATNAVVATISVGRAGLAGPNWLAEGLGSIWVGVPNASSVVRIDEATNAVLATIGALGTSPCGGLVVGPAAVWTTSCDGGNLLGRIDPTTNNAVTTVDLGGRAYTVVVVAGAPWTSPEPGYLVRIDPATNAIDRVVIPGPAYGPGGGDVVIASGSLWVVDAANDQVIRIPLSALGG